MLNDPIVTEIHEVREQLLKECDGNLERLVARLRKREAEDADRVVSSIEEGRQLRSAELERAIDRT